MEITVPATRRPWGRMPTKIRDLESRMPMWHSYRNSQYPTWAHETTHGLNNALRNKHRTAGPINAFYLFDGVALLANEPQFTIESIASKVPAKLRGNIYDMYLVQQAGSWNDRPLYLFDEWVSYQNGSLVALDTKDSSRDDSLLSCVEMAIYCSYVMEGGVTSGYHIKPDETVSAAYRRLLQRLHGLCSAYRTVISPTYRTGVNNRLASVAGSAAETQFRLAGFPPDSFMLS
jgi:hypothetical protein